MIFWTKRVATVIKIRRVPYNDELKDSDRNRQKKKTISSKEMTKLSENRTIFWWQFRILPSSNEIM